MRETVPPAAAGRLHLEMAIFVSSDREVAAYPAQLLGGKLARVRRPFAAMALGRGPRRENRRRMRE